MRVAVVGGGLAGLAAALDLVDAGRGGDAARGAADARRRRADAARTRGRPAPPPDNGQHIALGCFTEYLRFLDRIGEGGSFLRTRLALPVIAEDGSARAIAPSLPALLRTATCRCATACGSPSSLARCARRAAARTRRSARSSAGSARPMRRSTASGTSSSGRRSTSAPTRSTPRPVSSPCVRRCSARARTRDLILPTRPLGWMHGDAAGRVARRPRPRSSERVASLDELDADAIVVAVPPGESARLLGEPRPGLEDSPIVSVHLWLDRKLLRRRSRRCSERTRTGSSTAARSPGAGRSAAST